MEKLVKDIGKKEVVRMLKVIMENNTKNIGIGKNVDNINKKK